MKQRTLTPRSDAAMMQRLLAKLAAVETAIRNRDKADVQLRDALGALQWDVVAAKEMLHRWMSEGE